MYIISFVIDVNYTVSPLDVVVSAVRLAASSSDRSGAPLQLRVICENNLYSMGLYFEQYGGQRRTRRFISSSEARFIRSCLTMRWKLELEPTPSHRMTIVLASGYLSPQVLIQYPFYIVADKLEGVMTRAYRHISHILCHIVDSVRDNLAIGECPEIVIKGFRLTKCQDFSVPFEVSDEFLLLRVNAN